MNTTIDLLNLAQCDNSKTRCTSSSNVTSTSSNKTFEDVLKLQKDKTIDSNKDINQGNYSSLNNATVFNVTNISSSKKGLEFLNKLNTLVNDKSINSNTKLKDLLNNVMEAVKKVSSQIKDTQLSDEEKSEITEEVLQNLIAMLDNFVNLSQSNISFEEINPSLVTDVEGVSATTESLDLSLSSTLLNFDISTEDGLTELDDIAQSLDNISDKITSLFGDNSAVEENSELLEFMDNLSSVISQSDDKNIDTDLVRSLTKKEDISTNINNLDMSTILNNNIDTIDFRTDKVDNLHPVAKQILQTMQAQLGAVDLDGKTIEVRLKLYPSKLGEISVVIGRRGSDINVNILSDNADVRKLLSDSINILKNNLAESNSGSVNIDISNGNSNDDRRQNNNNNSIDITDNVDKYVDDVTLKLQVSNSLTNKVLDIKL